MATHPLFAPGLVKLGFHHTLGGRDWHIFRWISFGTLPFTLTEADLDSVALQAQSAMAGVFAFTTTDNTIDGTTAQDFTSDTGLTGSATAGGTGTEAPPTLPIQCSASVSQKINRRYRGGHPKYFLSGIAEARQTANRLWTSGFQTGLEAAELAAQVALRNITLTVGGTTYGVQLVNNSRFTGHVERVAPQLDNIVGAAVQGVIASQRRRRGRA